MPSGEPPARDQFTAAHWNGRFRVAVHRQPSTAVADVEQRAQALFGREIDTTTWARLVGAPDGSTVEVLPSSEIGYRDAVQLLMHHPWFAGHAVRYVFRDPAGRIGMLNDLFWVHETAPAGVGTRVFAHQVREAQAAGAVYLLAEAAGSAGSIMNGYYTWARLGFDGPIPASVRIRLPASFADAQYVLDVVERPGGTAWWKANGRTFRGVFDLREPSRSLVILRSYTDEKSIVI